jgi:hypothetical protein
MKTGILALALSAALVPGVALAQSSTVTGAAGGAATGAIVGGPVGAVVGGVAGAAVGTMIDPPPAPVREYVVREAPATQSVVVERQVVVGEPLPETVEVRRVPNYDYSYAVVNDRRVIVEPGTRRVIEVID